MKQVRCLIFCFCGEEPNEGVISTLSANLNAMCETVGTIDVAVCSGEEIAHSVYHDLQAHQVQNAGPEMNAAESAAVYIGTVLANVLNAQPFSSSAFVRKLTDKMTDCSFNPSDEDNAKFMNAMFILSQQDLHISKKILRRYNLDPTKIEIIRRTYNFFKSL